MKNLVLNVVLGFVLASGVAHASFQPEWDRPIEAAEMEIVEASGMYKSTDVVQVTRTQRDGLGEESTAYAVRLNGQEEKYVITEKSIRSDGAAALTLAREKDLRKAGGDFVHLYLVDHSKSMNTRFVPFLWEARLTRTRITNGAHAVGTIDMQGNPEAVYTIQRF